MKILYSVQATGNGHIARAMELLPFLSRYGKVDVFLSGNNSSLHSGLPVTFRSKGVSLFYGNRGGLDYWKMLTAFSPLRILREAQALPVEKYDLVINDFESITALSCGLKGVPFIHFGHQASFLSGHTPRPAKKDLAGEWILKNYARSDNYVGLHFKRYADFIYSPVLKKSVLQAEPVDNGHITVYLSHYSDAVVEKKLSALKDVCFHVFSRSVRQVVQKGNIIFIPISNEGFTQSMIHSHGVITGAGFETPAEALFMGKKLLCLPIQGQYEQFCNAAALEEFDVPICHSMNELFPARVEAWLNGPGQEKLHLQYSTASIVDHVMEKGMNMRANRQLKQLSSLNLAPECLF